MIIFILITLSFNPGYTFDHTKIDYCILKCQDGTISSGCVEKCKKSQERHEIRNDLKEFRKTIIDYHNDLRNRLAKGEEGSKRYPPAADMHVLNYDLELEYIALCHILSTFTSERDMCRMTSYCQQGFGPGQNLFGSSEKDTSVKFAEKAIQAWYDEITGIPEDDRDITVAKFSVEVVSEWQAADFTQVVWASMTRIGCGRAWQPTNKQETYRFILACNYAGPDEMCTANMVNRPIYTAGDPCTKCGRKEKCNNQTGGQYDALCGESEEIPSNQLAALESKSSRRSPNAFLFILVIVANRIRVMAT